MGVEPARVRHHPQLGAAERLGLAAERGLPAAEGGAVRRDAGDRHHPGPDPLDQRRPAAGRRRGARSAVSSSARAVARRTTLVMPMPRERRCVAVVVGHPGRRVDRPLDDPGREQRGVEAVDRVREVRLGRGGPEAGVDADEEQPEVAGRPGSRSGTSASRKDSSSARVKRAGGHPRSLPEPGRRALPSHGHATPSRISCLPRPPAGRRARCLR